MHWVQRRGKTEAGTQSSKPAVFQRIFASGHSDWRKGRKVSVSGFEQKELRSQVLDVLYISQFTTSGLCRNKCYSCLRFSHCLMWQRGYWHPKQPSLRFIYLFSKICQAYTLPSEIFWPLQMQIQWIKQSLCLQEFDIFTMNEDNKQRGKCT